MAGNSFGKILVLTTFGESHGPVTGGVLDGFPSGFPVDMEFIQSELNRRSPGKLEFSSSRKENDRIEIVSGIFEGKTTGSPIAFIIPNKDQKPEDYEFLRDLYRPSHADYTWEKKYGFRDHRGGGRSSARETPARVAGGAFARMFLKSKGIQIEGAIDELAGFSMPEEEELAKSYLKDLQAIGDTAGGVILCVISGVPAGLGEPVFGKLQSDLAAAMMSIPSVKGFEYGSGFAGARMKGSEHNDRYIPSGQQKFLTGSGHSHQKGKQRVSQVVPDLDTVTNFSGGIQGGISNGMPVYFRVAFKPVSSVMISQETIGRSGKKTEYTGKGRHDVCVVPRAVVIVEAMAALVIADHLLMKNAWDAGRGIL